ncbi:MAG: TVP38/TMEM64 family protein [bacterium]|nr:TVP38/TMEM64 family protein [bacterium]MDT8365512.1 TVP38/TMEM64 family protein [bacterium]
MNSIKQQDREPANSNGAPQAREDRLRRHIFLGLLLIAVIILTYILLHRTGTVSLFMDSKKLHAVIERAGSMGPLVIICFFMIAVVINPLPSAPIALAAGFAYGHTWGTLYVVIGSVSGAFISFIIARLLGHDILYRWFGEKLKVGLLGSQMGLMGMILVFRLLPFISFDIVSYAAGLTSITWWRFLFATTVGIIPTSFVLAHFGSIMSTKDPGHIGLTVLLLGFMTVIPVAVKLFLNRRRRNADDPPDTKTR